MRRVINFCSYTFFWLKTLFSGPPKILSNHTQFGSQGDTVNIECAAFAIPRIDSIVWTFDGKDIDSLHDQVSGVEDVPFPGN